MSTAIHIELNCLCLLVLFVIVWQSIRNVNQQMRIIRFRNCVYGIMAALVLDTLWMLTDGKQFPGCIAVNYILNALFLGMSVLLGCMWYLYVLETLGYHISRIYSWIVLLPGLFFLGLNIVSIWTGWLFYIDDRNVYFRGPQFWLQEIGGIIMLLISFFHILIYAIKNKKKVSNNEIRELLGFYIIPVLGTLVTVQYTGMPGTWTCAAISVMLMYMNSLDHEIMRDSLTGLNNRKVLTGAFTEYSKIANDSNRLYLFMMDLDGFKEINDRYGHPEGDRALFKAGRLLLRSVSNMRSVVVRYGGDEFLVMGFPGNDPEAYKTRTEALFAEQNTSSELPFPLNISIGFTEYKPGQTLNELIAVADQFLYSRKRSKLR